MAGPVGAYLTWTDATGLLRSMTFDVVVAEDWDESATVTEHPVEVGSNVTDHVRAELPTCKLTVKSTNEPINGNDWDTAIVTSVFLNVASPPQFVPLPSVLIASTWVNPIELRQLVGGLAGLIGSALSPSVGTALGITGTVLGQVLLPAFEVNVPVATTAGLSPSPPVPPVSVQVQQYPRGIDYVAARHSLLVELKNSAQAFDVIGSKSVGYSMVIESLSFHRELDTGSGEEITIGLKKLRIVQTQTVTAPIPNLSGGGGNPPIKKGGQEGKDAPAQQQTAILKLMQAGGMALP